MFLYMVFEWSKEGYLILLSDNVWTDHCRNLYFWSFGNFLLFILLYSVIPRVKNLLVHTRKIYTFHAEQFSDKNLFEVFNDWPFHIVLAKVENIFTYSNLWHYVTNNKEIENIVYIFLVGVPMLVVDHWLYHRGSLPIEALCIKLESISEKKLKTGFFKKVLANLQIVFKILWHQ